LIDKKLISLSINYDRYLCLNLSLIDFYPSTLIESIWLIPLGFIAGLLGSIIGLGGGIIIFSILLQSFYNTKNH